MKKQTLKKLSLKKVQISKLKDIKGGLHDANRDTPLALPKTCIGDVCPITMFIVCPSAAAAAE